MYIVPPVSHCFLFVIIVVIILVTLPDGVKAGQTIHVQAPDGQVNAIVVPEGFGPGSTFTVEFASEETSPPPPSKVEPHQNQSAGQPPPPPPAQGNTGDDGFASGFNNPGWTPATAQPAANTSSTYAEPDIQLGASYPTTSATPVYNTAPVYPK